MTGISPEATGISPEATGISPGVTGISPGVCALCIVHYNKYDHPCDRQVYSIQVYSVLDSKLPS